MQRPGPDARLLAALAAAVIGLPAATAAAPVTSESAGVTIDWSRGLAVATAAAPGDLRSPSPSVARIKARRHAREAAEERLRAAARELPTAADLRFDAAAEARLDRALSAALVLDVDHGSDGSVVVTLGLPLDAVRTSLAAADEPPAGEGPQTVVVDARRLELAPAVGLALAAGEVRYRGPVVYLRRPAEVGRDPRVAAPRARTRATEVTAGALTVAMPPEELQDAVRGRPLVVVLVRGAK